MSPATARPSGSAAPRSPASAAKSTCDAASAAAVSSSTISSSRAARSTPARAWCEATLRRRAGPGGRHALMGTHNRLLAIGVGRASRAAISSSSRSIPTRRRRRGAAGSTSTRRPGRRLIDAARGWSTGSRAATTSMAASAALRRAGFDPGPIVAAERMTPRGLLRWRITLRDDGRRPAAGAVPLLIEWGEVASVRRRCRHAASRSHRSCSAASPAELAAWLGVAVAVDRRRRWPSCRARAVASRSPRRSRVALERDRSRQRLKLQARAMRRQAPPRPGPACARLRE